MPVKNRHLKTIWSCSTEKMLEKKCFNRFHFLAEKKEKEKKLRRFPTENFYGQNMTGMFQISHHSKL
jgi:hypothetical protein